MGELKQYECPKCGYTTPVLHFGCGFRDYYEVYICKACQTIQSSLVATEDCMSEFDEESELDNVNLVTVYGEDYNNKELVEYSKREKAKKCNHCSSQVISEIPYQIEIDFQNMTDVDKRLPHMKYYTTSKDIVRMIRRGKKQIIHCNDCNNDVTYNSFVNDFNIKCVHCGSIQLEVWDEKHCPKCGEEMVWGGDWGRNILEAFWD